MQLLGLQIASVGLVIYIFLVITAKAGLRLPAPLALSLLYGSPLTMAIGLLTMIGSAT